MSTIFYGMMRILSNSVYIEPPEQSGKQDRGGTQVQPRNRIIRPWANQVKIEGNQQNRHSSVGR